MFRVDGWGPAFAMCITESMCAQKTKARHNCSQLPTHFAIVVQAKASVPVSAIHTAGSADPGSAGCGGCLRSHVWRWG